MVIIELPSLGFFSLFLFLDRFRFDLPPELSVLFTEFASG
jgi:hypothetical protein